MTNVALVDPKYLDGEPWEVAQRAGEQTVAGLDLAIEALEGFKWAARGSWLSQEDHRTGSMPSGSEFEESPLGQRLQLNEKALQDIRAQIAVFTQAAAYDPRVAA